MAKKFYSPIVPLGKVIFKFISRNENVVFKIVTKSINTKTDEIIEGDTLISESQAVHLANFFGVEIKVLDKKEKFEEMTYEQYENQQKELEKELEENRNDLEE